jgi:hypothetical protein
MHRRSTRRRYSWVPSSYETCPVKIAPRMTLREAYRVLDVSPSAPWAAIKRAYRHLVLRCHPDRFEQGTAAYSAAENRLKQVNQAYEQLHAARRQRQQRVTPRSVVTSSVVTSSHASSAHRAVQAQTMRPPPDASRHDSSAGPAHRADVDIFDLLPQGGARVLGVAGAVGIFCLGVLWSSSVAAMLAWTASWAVLAVGVLSLSSRVHP